MNKQQANMLMDMIKIECSKHDEWCNGCPFKYVDENNLDICFIMEGFNPNKYNGELLQK